VAVVLGERSSAARTIRAAGLFEHGFEIYPWKAVLAPTLATWPVETPEGAKAPDMRSVVCNGRRVVRIAAAAAAAKKLKGKRPHLNPGHRRIESGILWYTRLETHPPMNTESPSFRLLF
jgi:D-alanyl-D-alanine carboxypeptidase